MVVSLSLDAAAADASLRRQVAALSSAVIKSKRIVVVTGAGISCSCGIPDFRSSDGLYNLVKQQYPDVVMKGRDLFDASLFRDPTSTSVFYTFISQLKQSVDAASPSPTHAFLKTLDTKKRLLRSYTQNIDGFEERAGLLGSSSDDARAATSKGKSKLKTKDVRNVQLHGDIHRVRCTFCSADLPCTEEYLRLFNEGVAPDCPECNARSEARVARSARALKVGTLRPAIVLYDEPHPLGDDIGTIQTGDLAKRPDLLIVMGTSLKVHGLKKLVKEFARTVHAGAPSPPAVTTGPAASSSKSTSTPRMSHKVIFVNKTAPGSEWNGIIDYHVEGTTDEWVERVVEQWRRDRPEDWEVQTTLDGPAASGVAVGEEGQKFKVAKGKTKGKKGKKAALPERENIPPTDDAFDVPSTKPPSSPTKRRHSTSHYSALDSSPPKRRSFTESQQNRPHGHVHVPSPTQPSHVLGDERDRSCFANTTNNAKADAAAADETDTDEEFPMTITIPKPPKHRAAATAVTAVAPLPPPLRKKASAARMKLEIPMPPSGSQRQAVGVAALPPPRPQSRSQMGRRSKRLEIDDIVA